MNTPKGCGQVDDGCGGVLWCGSCSCGSTFRACELDVPVIAEVTTTVTANVPLVTETRDLSSGADSVLHILDATTGAQLVMNDDYGGLPRSHIRYVSPTTRQVRIVARAKSPSTTGTGGHNKWHRLSGPSQNAVATGSVPWRVVS